MRKSSQKFTLRERLSEGRPIEYGINQGDYQPQQFCWVPNEHIDDVLRGNCKLSQSKLTKPAGVWISGNEGWVEWCEIDNPDFLIDTTPLKAYVSPEIRICEIGSREDFESLCERLRIDYSKISVQESRSEDYEELFDAIKREGYGGIHLSHRGMRNLQDHEFFGWDSDCTVIFDPRNLSFELLTPKELKILGWDKYDWIKTLEGYREDCEGERK